MESQVIGSFRLALDLAVKATFLFSLTGLLLWLLRRRSAAARHLLGTAGLAAALLFPLLGSVLPSLEVPLLPTPVADTRLSSPVWPRHLGRTAETARASNGVDARESAALPPDFDDARSPALSALAPERFGERETKKPAPSLFVLPLTAMAAALGIWIGGAAVLLARLAVGLARVRSCRQRATRILSPAWTALAHNLGESVGTSGGGGSSCCTSSLISLAAIGPRCSSPRSSPRSTGSIRSSGFSRGACGATARERPTTACCPRGPSRRFTRATFSGSFGP